MDDDNDNYPWTNLSPAASVDNNDNNSQAANGINNIQDLPNDGQIVERTTVSSSVFIECLIQQLCTMFEDDPLQRNKLYFAICDKLHAMNLIDSSYNMDEFESLRGQYQRALYKLVSGSRAATGCGTILQNPRILVHQSRYKTEFEELNYLASGGFGHVYKARHRLDKNDYAVKKICVPYMPGRIDKILKHLEEVETLAKLNHSNIVSYKGAWIERGPPSTSVPCLPGKLNSVKIQRTRSLKKMSLRHSTKSSKNASQLTSNNLSAHQNDGPLSRNNSERNPLSLFRSTDKNIKTSGTYLSYEREIRNQQDNDNSILCSIDIVTERFQQLNSTTTIIGRRIKEESSCNVVEEASSDIVSFRNDDKQSNEEANDDTATSSDVEEIDSSDETEDNNDLNRRINCNRQVCEYVNPAMRQTVATLYIQMALCEQTLRQWLDERQECTSLSMITIILMQILRGLEYIHSHNIVHHDIKPSNIFISTSRQVHVQLGDFGLACPLQQKGHHPMVGTQLYAAPEQLDGQCDPKSDVYSMGIVLLELMVPTQTQMERIEVINQLRSGQIPETLCLQHPKWAEVIRALVDTDPTRRPSTTDLLQNLSEDKDMIIAKLTSDNKKQEEIIRGLERENEQLRDRLNKLEAKIKIETIDNTLDYCNS